MRTPDEEKSDLIIKFLEKHPDGTYVSEIARGTGLSKSTVSFLLSGRLADKVEIILRGKSDLFKIVRLKKK